MLLRTHSSLSHTCRSLSHTQAQFFLSLTHMLSHICSSLSHSLTPSSLCLTHTFFLSHTHTVLCRPHSHSRTVFSVSNIRTVTHAQFRLTCTHSQFSLSHPCTQSLAHTQLTVLTPPTINVFPSCESSETQLVLLWDRGLVPNRSMLQTCMKSALEVTGHQGRVCTGAKGF